ncbi:MAG: phosphate ABC transporter substrate-binding protein [Ignavibacteria bacterium]|nr:phosphate ABC transporter substrate-binding protein [Ignavibacteria bacterium]
MISNKITKYFVIGLLMISGCQFHPPIKNEIRIKGSDTMLLLTGRLAATFMKNNPQYIVINEGGGSLVGIKALIKGEVDLCAASRTLKADEIKSLAENFNVVGISHLIAKDALSIFVNQKNQMRDLSLDQIRKIFSGEITDWSEVGGEPGKINVIIRSPNSGTHYYFYEHVLEEKDYASSAIIRNTTEDVLNEIRTDSLAIGYGGIGYANDVPHIQINGIDPKIENVRNNSYPIIRYLYFYTLNTVDGITKKFFDWVISPEGQQVVEESGYIPLWDTNR